MQFVQGFVHLQTDTVEICRFESMTEKKKWPWDLRRSLGGRNGGEENHGPPWNELKYHCYPCNFANCNRFDTEQSLSWLQHSLHPRFWQNGETTTLHRLFTASSPSLELPFNNYNISRYQSYCFTYLLAARSSSTNATDKNQSLIAWKLRLEICSEHLRANRSGT